MRSESAKRIAVSGTHMTVHQHHDNCVCAAAAASLLREVGAGTREGQPNHRHVSKCTFA